MGTEINPKKLQGPWVRGYALDVHTLESTYLGDDAYGHPQFDTKRSPVGDLLYKLKYRNDQRVVPRLIEAVMTLWRTWKPTIDVIIPVPPSNLSRKSQPVVVVATALAEHLEVPLYTKSLKKIKNTPELKNVFEYDQRMEALEGAFTVVTNNTAGKRILLFDDLYRSGATVAAITNALKNEGKAKAIYLLTLTRTRSNF